MALLKVHHLTGLGRRTRKNFKQGVFVDFITSLDGYGSW